MGESDRDGRRLAPEVSFDMHTTAHSYTSHHYFHCKFDVKNILRFKKTLKRYLQWTATGRQNVFFNGVTGSTNYTQRQAPQSVAVS